MQIALNSLGSPGSIRLAGASTHPVAAADEFALAEMGECLTQRFRLTSQRNIEMMGDVAGRQRPGVQRWLRS